MADLTHLLSPHWFWLYSTSMHDCARIIFCCTVLVPPSSSTHNAQVTTTHHKSKHVSMRYSKLIITSSHVDQNVTKMHKIDLQYFLKRSFFMIQSLVLIASGNLHCDCCKILMITRLSYMTPTIALMPRPLYCLYVQSLLSRLNHSQMSCLHALFQSPTGSVGRKLFIMILIYAKPIERSEKNIIIQSYFGLRNKTFVLILFKTFSMGKAGVFPVSCRYCSLT